jgi:hypothetical protein
VGVISVYSQYIENKDVNLNQDVTIMLSQVAESTMHRVRWAIALAWLLLIVSLFYDPISPLWTATLEPLACVPVQDQCVEEIAGYAVAPRIFWGMTVPNAIFFVLVFGHEAWRRICPLYFLSQLPRALGIGPRQPVDPDSWLARNHLYVQFGLLFFGLCCRILFINSDRVLLGLFLLGTIALAMTIVYRYGGRSWCHYFCPFGLVQLVFTGPRGLLDSKAKPEVNNGITQSMCRSIDAYGEEQSACVGCKSPCLDIDSDRAYWDQLSHQPGRRWVQYGYFGLVTGYVVYYKLYAGSFDYYYSGIWNREVGPLKHLWDAGFYLYGEAIAIPKIFAAPLTLAVFSLLFYLVGLVVERRYRRGLRQWSDRPIVLAKHRMFTLVTFLAFNTFFLYGGQPELRLMPHWVQYLAHSTTMFVSTLWLIRTWKSKPVLEPAADPIVVAETSPCTLLRKPQGDRMAKTRLR